MKQGTLDHNQYYAAEEALVKAGYSPMVLNSSLFLWRLQQQGCRITKSTLDTLQLLNARHCSLPAALAFACELFLALMVDPVPVFVKNLLTDAIIGELRSGRSSHVVLPSLRIELLKRLPSKSQYLKELLARIAIWELRHVARI